MVHPGAIVLRLENLATPSEVNLTSEHWRKRHRRSQVHRICVHTVWERERVPPLTPPLDVVLVRIAPRKLDSDNLASALKHVRDGVAAKLGLKNDGNDDEVRWQCQQRKGKPHETAVEIIISERDEDVAPLEERTEDLWALATELVELWPRLNVSGPPEPARAADACVNGLRSVLGVAS